MKKDKNNIIKFKDKINVNLKIREITKDKCNILFLGNLIGLFGYFNEDKSDFNFNRIDIHNKIFKNNFNFLYKALRGEYTFTFVGDYNMRLYFEEIKQFFKNAYQTNPEFNNIINNIDFRFNYITTYNTADYKIILNYLTINNMKFDVAIINPPYDNGLCEKFQEQMFDLTTEDGQICWVAPSTWLLGKKQNKRLCEKVDKYYCEIESINPGLYFDAAIGGLMSTVYIDKSRGQKIVFDKKEYNKCEGITTYSNDDLLMEFKNIVEPLYKHDNLQKHIKYIPNIDVHSTGKTKFTENNPEPNWWCMRIQGMRGHKNTWDFYTLISNQEKELNKLQGQYKDLSNKYIIQTNKGTGAVKKHYMEYYFSFNTEQELHNFINYCKTDFCRGCLYLIKTGLNLLMGQLYDIPYFDFSNLVFSKSPSEIDDYLFAKYNISDEIRRHIEDILPDYYGIRN